jgi:hypothetical protein
MASDISDIFEYVAWLVWTILTLTPAKLKNPVQAIILTSQDVVAKLMSDSELEFALGLWDVVQASAPPSINFFKSLPSFFKRSRGIYVKRWAVYAVVLRRSSVVPSSTLVLVRIQMVVYVNDFCSMRIWKTFPSLFVLP